ncbi:MAG: hypothetical protein EBS82_03065, partial [Methylocystaceae bacterium]|nr:hypothetical protein [Methylocystaceae bacterium]
NRRRRGIGRERHASRSPTMIAPAREIPTLKTPRLWAYRRLLPLLIGGSCLIGRFGLSSEAC